MHTSEAEDLLAALRGGTIHAADLTGEQFQSIIFHRLIGHCLTQQGFDYELLDNYQGAVDFVVREKARRISQFHTDDPVHVFECKHYCRTLELNTIAKLLIVGVRFQPTSLNVVSRTTLQPQVFEYARMLFNGLGNDTAMFRRTVFRHYRTSELLELEVNPNHDEADASIGNKIGRAGTVDLSWEIAECRPFLETIVATSSKLRTLILDNRCIYRVRVSLLTTSNPNDFRIWMDAGPGTLEIQSQVRQITALGEGLNHISSSLVLDPRRLEKTTGGNLALHITYKTRSHRVSTIPVSASPQQSQPVYPDLRDDSAQEFAVQLHHRAAPRLVFIGGEAGVGKTHFCEQIAERLQFNGEFHVNRFLANANRETSLLRTMLISICTPAAAHSKNTGEWDDLAGAIVNALSPVQQSTPSKSVLESAELIVPVLAEFLVRSGPRLVVFRDAHLLTEVTARELSTLVGRLDDLGWGDVYFLVEHRTGGAEKNPHWDDFESEIRAQVNGCLDMHLEPLSLSEVNDLLDSMFIHITLELKDALWRVCGGVPLYLFSFFELLRSKGAIKHHNNQRWIIEAPSVFLEPARTGRRADGVLEERLKTINWQTTILPEHFRASPIVLVALLGIAQEPSRVKKLCESAGIDSEAYRSVRRTLLRHTIIKQSGDEWSFDFQHDLLRQIAIEMGARTELAQTLVERLLRELRDPSSSALDLELCADLSSWLGFQEDAVRALNAAFECVHNNENFTLTRRILWKLCEAMRPAAFGTAKTYREYLECRSALAWTTWNSGSLKEARKEYSRLVADARLRCPTNIDAAESEAYAADAQRRILGIDLELENIPAFVRSARYALELNGNWVVFNSIMNRLILYCAWYSHVDLGLELAHMLLQTFGDTEPESCGAVICSDIGALFRAADPQTALALYRRGVQLAVGGRQRIHNELDVVITEVLLGERGIEDQELAQIRKGLVDNGLKSILSRFDLFCASFALRQGQLSRAQTLYRHVETSVAVYRYEEQWIDLWNDTMIAALIRGDLKEAHRLQSLLVARLAHLVKARRKAVDHLIALHPAIEKQRNRFSHLAALSLDLPSEVPAYSGTFVQAMLNLEALSGVKGSVTKSTVRKLSGIWPSDIDHSAAITAFLNQPPESSVEFRDVRLALCAQ